MVGGWCCLCVYSAALPGTPLPAAFPAGSLQSLRSPGSAPSRAGPCRALPHPGRAKMRPQDRHPPCPSPFPAPRTKVPRSLGGGMRGQRGPWGGGWDGKGGEAGHPPASAAQRCSAGQRASLSTGCRGGAWHPSGRDGARAWDGAGRGWGGPAGCSGLFSVPLLLPPSLPPKAPKSHPSNRKQSSAAPRTAAGERVGGEETVNYPFRLPAGGDEIRFFFFFFSLRYATAPRRVQMTM